MTQQRHKKPGWSKQGLKLSPRQLDRYQHTGATMLSQTTKVSAQGKSTHD